MPNSYVVTVCASHLSHHLQAWLGVRGISFSQVLVPEAQLLQPASGVGGGSSGGGAAFAGKPADCVAESFLLPGSPLDPAGGAEPRTLTLRTAGAVHASLARTLAGSPSADWRVRWVALQALPAPGDGGGGSSDEGEEETAEEEDGDEETEEESEAALRRRQQRPRPRQQQQQQQQPRTFFFEVDQARAVVVVNL